MSTMAENRSLNISEESRESKYITRKKLEDILRGEYVRKESFERLKQEVDELRQLIVDLHYEIIGNFVKYETREVIIESEDHLILMGVADSIEMNSRAIFKPILNKPFQAEDNEADPEETLDDKCKGLTNGAAPGVHVSVCSSQDQPNEYKGETSIFNLTSYTISNSICNGMAVSFNINIEGKSYMMYGENPNDFLHFKEKAIPKVIRKSSSKYIFYQTHFSPGNDVMFESSLHPGYYLTMEKEPPDTPFKLFLKTKESAVSEKCKFKITPRPEKSENCF